MRLLSALLVGLPLFAVAVTGQPQTTQATTVKDIERVILERLDAASRGDGVAWAKYVADDCICSTSTKASLQAEISSRPASFRNWYSDVVGLEVRLHDETAVVRYRVTEHSQVGTQKVSFGVFRVETYRRLNGEWKLIAGADRGIPSDPTIVDLHPKALDAFVGRYEYAPGIVDTIKREGRQLIMLPAGQAREEIFAENNTTFFGKGQDWRMIFIKDAKGRVTGFRFRQNGTDFVAKKLR